MLIKTIHERGVGYDRPFDYDEINIDLKVYQHVDGKTRVYEQYEGLETLMQERKHVSLVLKKILQSMKTKENVSCVVRPEYFLERDPEYAQLKGIK